jgi:hypothetical protein
MKFLVAIFISFFLFFSGCGGGGGGGSSAGTVKIMPLGDSITYDDARAYYDSSGKNLVPAGERTAYRSFLAYDLDDAGVSYDFVGSRRAGYDVEPKFDPDNEGHPGWTSWEIADHVYEFLEQNTPDVILLHIGTNDRAGGRVDGVERILNEIDRFKKDHNKKIKVFVALIINRWLWDRTIEKYNANLLALLQNRNDPDIVIVDMREIISGGHGDYLENTHPNKQGYKKIADVWFTALMDSDVFK